MIPQFGTPVAGVPEVLRPGGYCVVVRADSVAVVKTPLGLFLPGGGKGPDESLEAAALREAREECGLVLELGASLGTADELLWVPAEQTYFRKRGTFFAATLLAFDPREATEADHELVWLPLDRAESTLHHGSHRWALGRITMARRVP